MKLISRALVSAAIVALPSVAQAQFDVQLTLTGQTIAAAGSGGQFAGSATTLGSLTAYCIDPFRNIRQYNFPATYRVFTFTQYVAWAQTANPLSIFPNSAFMTELNRFAQNANTIASSGAGATADAAQTQTWNWFGQAGNQNVGGNAVDNGTWRVLVSVDAINQQQFDGFNVNGYQTMITAVPEPSTYVLMFSGLALVGIAARRRKVS